MICHVFTYWISASLISKTVSPGEQMPLYIQLLKKNVQSQQSTLNLNRHLGNIC